MTKELMAEHDAHGPRLQVVLFEAGARPDEEQAALFADAARTIW